MKAIYTLFEDEINQEAAFRLSDDHVKILDERRSKHLGGKDDTTNWQQVHENIRKKRKSNGV